MSDAADAGGGDIVISTLPEPVKTPLYFYHRKNQAECELEVLKEMSAPLVGSVNMNEVTLPPGFASLADNLGRLVTCDKETTKRCRTFMEARKVPRHMIPKVGMGPRGAVALRHAAALEAERFRAEETLRETRPKDIERGIRLLVRKKFAQARPQEIKECEDESALDRRRWKRQMKQHADAIDCECSRVKKCKGIKCLCRCYFCQQDRWHTAAKNCQCCPYTRKARAGSGSVGVRANTEMGSYRRPPGQECPCAWKRHCAIIGCSCYCSFCLMRKAKQIRQETTGPAAHYCPCLEKRCPGVTCPCRCFKCAAAKARAGQCPGATLLR